MGGIVLRPTVGYLLDHGFGYALVFPSPARSTSSHSPSSAWPFPRSIRRRCAARLQERHENHRNPHPRRPMARQDRPAAAALLHQPHGLARACRAASMGTFTFHGWLIVEIFTDDGLVGIGNAALAPHVTKQVIDLYLKPLLIGADPWDIEFLWQHMYRKTMAFGRKGIGMVAISAVDIALWDLLGKSAKQPVYRLLGGRTKPRIPVYASRLYSTPLDELAAEATALQGRRLQGHEAALRLGPGRRRRRNAAEMSSCPHRPRNRRRRHRHHGRRLHGLDARLRQAHAAAARAVQSALARRARHPRRHPRLRRAQSATAASPSPAASTNSRSTASANCSRPRASTTSSSTPTASAASRRRARSPPWPRRTRSPSFPHAGQMHNYHVVMASLNSPMAEYFPLVDVEVGNELFWYIFKGEPDGQGRLHRSRRRHARASASPSTKQALKQVRRACE